MQCGVRFNNSIQFFISKDAIIFLSGSDGDLEYFVRECGDILAITGKLAADKRDAKHILEYVLHQVVEFKKLNQVCIC